MNERPSYLEQQEKQSSKAFVMMLGVIWSLTVLISFLFFAEQKNASPTIKPQYQEDMMSPWVLSTSKKIEQIRQLTLHLARDYQTVEFLADTSETGDDISSYWQSFKQQHNYISQIGVVEEETSDHFYVGQHIQRSPSMSGSEELMNYWMQVGLLENNDILFYEFTGQEQGMLFRFTTPVHYEDMRLGHLYIDLDVDQLLVETSLEFSDKTNRDNVFMLDMEGNYVAELTKATWSAKQAFEKSIGYYYPEFWQSMNAGLSGHFSTSSQQAYFSKLDIPWYENQIKYFYLIQISEKENINLSDPNVWKPALFIWLVGVIGLWLMQRRISQLISK